MTLKQSFEAVVDDRTRVLFLGSLPGDRSLEMREYYAHPTNHFWRLIGEVTALDLRAMPYDERVEALNAAGIGLWDVVKQARRSGSLDSAIRDHQGNDLLAMTAGLPNLRAVAFNGGKAFDIARRQALDFGSLAVIALPSSSGANGGYFSFEQKLARYLELRAYL